MKKPDIHLFDYEDRPILLQIETGAFFEVSDDLSPVHGLEAVAEALSELEAENLVSFGPVCPLLDSDVGAVASPTHRSTQAITITLLLATRRTLPTGRRCKNSLNSELCFVPKEVAPRPLLETIVIPGD